MSESEMRYTSINHCKNANYQIDYAGTQHNCISNFESWCIDHDVIWGKLFTEEKGVVVAEYFKELGLVSA